MSQIEYEQLQYAVWTVSYSNQIPSGYAQNQIWADSTCSFSRAGICKVIFEDCKDLLFLLKRCKTTAPSLFVSNLSDLCLLTSCQHDLALTPRRKTFGKTYVVTQWINSFEQTNISCHAVRVYKSNIYISNWLFMQQLLCFCSHHILKRHLSFEF